MKTKVTVVCAGNVGATVAQGIALKELADVVPRTIKWEEHPFIADMERRMKEMADKKAVEGAS